MVYYTIVQILTYIACSILAIFIGISVFKTEKVGDKISGVFFLAILLMRMFFIR